MIDNLTFEVLAKRLWPELLEVEAFKRIQSEARAGRIEVTGRLNGGAREFIKPLDFVDVGLFRWQMHVVAVPFRDGKPDPLIFKGEKLRPVGRHAARHFAPMTIISGVAHVQRAIDGTLAPDAWPVVWTTLVFRIDAAPCRPKGQGKKRAKWKPIIDSVFPGGIIPEEIEDGEIFKAVMQSRAFKDSEFAKLTTDHRRTILRAAGRDP